MLEVGKARDFVAGTSIFYPDHAQTEYLFGKYLGVLGFGTQPIYTSNIVLHRLDRNCSVKEALHNCGLVDDQELEPSTLFQLTRGMDVAAGHCTGNAGYAK